MNKITSLTDSARQSFQIPFEGDTISFKLYYYITQKSWFFDFTFNNYTSKGNRVVLTPNALRHLKNIIPFGVAFLADGYVEPFDINDFGNGRVEMYILDKEDVQEIESNIYGA